MTAYATTTARPLVAKPQAQDLFSQGYRCRLALDGNLLVTNPAGKRYMVNPRAETCSCPASVTCKHLNGARQLALAQVEELWKEGAEWEMASIAEDHNPVTRRMGVELIDAASKLYAWAWEVCK